MFGHWIIFSSAIIYGICKNILEAYHKKQHKKKITKDCCTLYEIRAVQSMTIMNGTFAITVRILSNHTIAL
jgi:hypothetical protein